MLMFKQGGVKPEGFSPVNSSGDYQMVPAGGKRTVIFQALGEDWTLLQSKYPQVDVRPQTPYPEWPTIPDGRSVPIILDATDTPGIATLQFYAGLETRKLVVSVLPKRLLTYTLAVITQDALNPDVKYDRSSINAATWGMERTYEAQTNVIFKCVAWADLKFPDRVLGNPIELADHIDVILAALPLAATHRSLIYSWDVEAKQFESFISGVTLGTTFKVVEHDAPWSTLVHEFGHSFGLGDHKIGLNNFMCYSEHRKDPLSFSHGQIEAINGFNDPSTIIV